MTRFWLVRLPRNFSEPIVHDLLPTHNDLVPFKLRYGDAEIAQFLDHLNRPSRLKGSSASVKQTDNTTDMAEANMSSVQAPVRV